MVTSYHNELPDTIDTKTRTSSIMQTNDPSLLFLSSQQLSDAASRENKIKAAENVGAPIKTSSKVLDLTVLGSDAWTAESGWQARRVDLNVEWNLEPG